MSKSKAQMSNKITNPKDKKRYDLGERTAKYGEDLIEFINSLPNTPVNLPLKSQAVRSGTSIGANYMEADAAESARDFNYKISLCKKEAKETMHWTRMLAKANPGKTEKCRKLWKEVHELTLIFSSILNTRQKKIKKG